MIRVSWLWVVVAVVTWESVVLVVDWNGWVWGFSDGLG